MRKSFNDGIVYTNEKCIGCNKCIASCPVGGACVALNDNGSERVEVASDKCLDCGACVLACNHKAREYKDDVTLFFDELSAGKKVSVMVSPAFYSAVGPEKAKQVLGYLKSLGVEHIYDVSFGAEICLWAHVKYLRENKENPERAFVGQTCPAVMNYLETVSPQLLKYVIPVQSPAVCTGIYAKKYLQDENSIAFISPCVAASDEAKAQTSLGSYQYNITFSKLMERLEDVDISNFGAEAEITGMGLGELVMDNGGFKEAVELFFSKQESIVCFDAMVNIDMPKQGNLVEDMRVRPLFAEFNNCVRGCLSGPGSIADIDYMEVFANSAIRRREIYSKLKDYLGEKSNFELLENYLGKLEAADFKREFNDRYQQVYQIPESAYEDIYNAMHKETEEKRKIDCGSCGHKTCREMVQAIAYGHNRMENCIHYMNDEMKHRFYMDALTGGYNKKGFLEHIDSFIKANRGKEFLMISASINQLNVINDLYGFAVGDKIIARGGRVCKRFLESKNGIFGRLGGGDFLVCVEFVEGYDKRIVADRYYDCTDIGVAFPVCYRAGVYRFTSNDECNFESIINYCIMARDAVEETTRNVFHFYDEQFKKRIDNEVIITSKMYEAIEDKEFVPYFQPQYNHKSGELIGAEVLCRWITRDGKMVSPGIFIPIFERNGFVCSLDKYMWEKAFECQERWLEEGMDPVPISVNISRISLRDDRFIEVITDIRNRYKVPEKYIHFEVTETAYSSNQVEMAKKVEILRSMNYRVSMDDFGSGYSSLNVLKDIPMDTIKLDLGFLRGENPNKGEQIIRHVVSMVKDLDYEIIAEGVETEQQADFLGDVGCNNIQGYYYARPMPQKDYEELLRKRVEARKANQK